MSSRKEIEEAKAKGNDRQYQLGVEIHQREDFHVM